jgi:endonuclease/exonuclease/phosphatase family metal-dependent hydrolase
MRSASALAVAAALLVCDANSTVTLQGETLTFKVATWNVRSGMGIRGFSTTTWTDTTFNCTDRSQPLNAWGEGLPQRALQTIKDDPSIVALAIQEAWRCGSPSNVNSVVQFKTATRQEEGVALLARHGFAGPPLYHQIDKAHNRWLIGGTVCLDPSCSRGVPMFSTHWGGAEDGDFPVQAGRAIEFLATQPAPRLFMGDLNVFKIDQWNPQAPCTVPDAAGRLKTIALIEGAGYVDAWKATQRTHGWTGMTSRKGCGSPSGSLYKRIDYVFSKGFQVRGSWLFARPAPGADAPSDHVGLIAELAFKPLIK